MFQSLMVRTLVAGLIVPFVAIGGPGTPMGRALAADRSVIADVPVVPGSSFRSVDPTGSVPGAGLDAGASLTTSSLRRPDGLTSVVRPDRIVIVESAEAHAGRGEADGARLMDGDTSTTFRPERGGAVRVIAHFRQALWLDGLSLSDGMGELHLLSAGPEVPISEVSPTVGGRPDTGPVSTPRRFALERPLWGQTFHFEWVLGSLELPAEWTFWQRGAAAALSLGEDSERLFVRGTPAGASEYWAEAKETQVSATALLSQSTRLGPSGAPDSSRAEVAVQVSDLAGKGRAFLVYELEGAPHFSAIRRSINGKRALGGARLVGEGAGGLQVEEVPLTSLVEGVNTIAFFPANPHVTGAYTVRNLRVVATPRSGTTSTLSFRGPGEMASFRRSAQAELAGLSVLDELAMEIREKSEGTLSLRAEGRTPFQVDLQGLDLGFHILKVPQTFGAVQRIEARLDAGVTPEAIGRVVVSSANLARSASADVVVSYPKNGECFDGEANLRGFVQGLTHPRVTVRGRRVEVAGDGSFEVVEVDPGHGPWQLDIQATDELGQTVHKSHAMQPCLATVQASARADQPIDDIGAPFAQVVTTQGGVVEFAGARLEIPEGALAEPTRITIRPLPASAVPKMNPGMANVTPLGQAYRFGPSGTKFEGPIRVTLPYDDGALAAAAQTHHIVGFYYDELSARWNHVARAGEAAAGSHTSFTDHFTDFVNATIATPDASGVASFNPTSMSEAALASALAGVASIAPPGASPWGHASVHYPFELPAGRAGMTPALGLSYSSEQKEGFVGYGWDLGISKIELDTRFGVPDYDSKFTQSVPGAMAGKVIYALDGEPLTQDGTSGEQFRRRVEGAFQQIVKLDAADQSGAKYFVVTAQDGTKYTYGKTAASRVYDPANPKHIFRWHLEEVQDVFTNGIKYAYKRVSKSLNGGTPCVLSASSTCGWELVPERIQYTTHAAAPTVSSYALSFEYDEADRADSTLSGRAGFLISNRSRLESVALLYEQGTRSSLVRKWTFDYEAGDFGKTLLKHVRQKGSNGTQFYLHTFGYSKADSESTAESSEDAPHWKSRFVHAFAPETTFAANVQPDYSLSQRTGWAFSIQGSVGIAFLDPRILGLSLGLSGNFGETDAKHSFLDISGDGLPDYLNTSGQVQLGQLGYAGSGVFNPAPYLGVDYDHGDVARDSFMGMTLAGGVGASASASAVGSSVSGEGNVSTSMDFRTLADMDGDGFLDRVEVNFGEIRVYPNQGSGTGAQAFENPSTDALKPYRTWGQFGILQGLTPDTGAAAQPAPNTQADPILRWVAPRAGHVTVAGQVRRSSGGERGARTTIYSQAGELWSNDFLSTYADPCVPSAPSGCNGDSLTLDVFPGDSLYFRVHPLPGQLESDSVVWTPTIVYDGANTEVEPYGRPIDRFSLVDDFRLGSGLSMPFSAALNGEALLGGNLTKQETSDELFARIWKVTVDEDHRQTRCILKEWVVPATATLMNLTISTQTLASPQGDCPPLANGALEAGTLLDFELTSDTVVDPSRVDWLPVVKYTSATVPDPFPGAPPISGSVSCTTAAGERVCVVQNGGSSAPVPFGVAERQAPVSFKPPSITPSERTQTFTVNASSIRLAGSLRRFARPARIVGLCQSQNQLLWKLEIDEDLLPSSEVEIPVDEEITGLTVGQVVSCTLKSEHVSEGRMELGATNVSAPSMPPTGTLQAVPINLRNEDPNYVVYVGGTVREWRSLSGGFHGWSFGDFRSEAGAFESNRFEDVQLAQQNFQQETPTFFPASPGSKRIEGLQTAAWQIRGGGFVTTDGLLQPGVLKAKDALDAGDQGDGAVAARISHSFTYGVNAATPWNSVGYAESNYVLDRDLIDMNGDNLPDTVTVFEVGYNTGCLPLGNENCSGRFVTGTREEAPDGFEPTPSTSTETKTRIAKTRLGAEVVLAGGQVNLIRPSRDGVPQAFSSLGIGLGTDYGWTTTHQQLIDMNGDGLPDYVRWDSNSQQTLVGLNLGYRRLEYFPWARAQNSMPNSSAVIVSELLHGVDGFTDHQNYIAARLRGDADEGETNAGGGDDGIGVELTRRTTDEGALAYSSVSTVTPSIGGGVDTGFFGASGGVAYQHSVRRDLGRLVDVTGDGLVDYVYTADRSLLGESGPSWLRFRPNLGTSFGSPQILEVPDWTSNPEVEGFLRELHVDSGHAFDSIGLSTSSDWTVFEEFHFCIIFVCAGLSSTQASIDSREQIAFQDADGDGLPDFVLKSKGSPATRVKLNKLGGINLLTSIQNPAGGETTIAYGRQGATHEHPGVHYAVSEVTIIDPPSSPYVVRYEQSRSGNYDRKERAFLGYGQVRETRPGVSQMETTYANTDYFRKGLPLSRAVYSDGTANGRTKYVSEGWAYEPPPSVPVGSPEALAQSHFPYEKTRTKTLFEGESAGLTSTETRTWDLTHGNLKTLAIQGDEPSKNVTYTITYVTPAANIVRAERVTAVSGGVTYRDRRATYGSLGELRTVANYNTTGATVLAQWSVDLRDIWGNPRHVTDPNLETFDYVYDPDFMAHVQSVTNGFGLSSTTTYDVLFGKPLSIVDANGHLTSYGYDEFARLVAVTGPKDQGTPVPTISYEYALPAYPATDSDHPLWALTRRKDAARNSANSTPSNHDFIETIQFVDGLGRVVETKKDHLRDSGTSLEIGMIVSGKVTYDSAGRPTMTGQPSFSADPSRTFSFQGTPLNPIVVTYDALDRPTSISAPWDDSPTGEPATTTIEYGLYQSQAGVLKHGTTVTEEYSAPGAQTTTLRDSDGEIAEVQQFNQIAGQQGLTMLVTSYETNSMNELTRVVDAKGNVTSALYDALGRTREMTSPDSGRTVFTYYPNGQLKTRETAQLRAKGQKTSYIYDRNRLTAIDYQDPTLVDTTFAFGAATQAGNASGNRAGRVVSESSEAGAKTYRYDELGNVIEQSMTFDRKADNTKPDYNYTLKYAYDSFGRLLETRFPGADKELVSYAYDQGGNLQSVYGQKLGFTPSLLSQPPHSTYLVHRGYDEFGQIKREISGNLSTTVRTYQPKSHRLATVDRIYRDDDHRQDPSVTYLNQQIYNYNGAGDVIHTINYPNLAPGSALQPMRSEVHYFYDNLHQLTRTEGLAIASDTQKYHYLVEQNYDEIGNIKLKDQTSYNDSFVNNTWTQTPVASQTYRNTYTYGGTQPHAPSRIATQGGPTTDFQYDPSGNQKQSTALGATRVATWTDDDKLRSLKRSTDSYDLTRSYYDGEGNKAIAVHPGATSMEEVAYHGGDLTVRVNGDNQYVTKHIYAGSERLASKMDPGWFQSSPIQYYATDHLGSAQYTMDGHQNLLSHTEFFPSGELWIDQLNADYGQSPRWMFTGKEWDATTGLYDFGARQYDPRVGQWLSPDPILASYMRGGPNGGAYNPANLGLYGYVYNNPINYVDRDGEFPIAIAIGVGLGVGIDLYQQYRANGGSLGWNNWDWKRTGLSAGFGALGGGAAMAGAAYGGASLGWTAFYSGVFGGATSGLQEATMQRYRGQDFDPQPVAQSWLLGTFGAALGAAAGPALAAALSRVNYGSRETYLLVQSFWNVNRGSLGGPLGGAKSLAAQSSAAGRELTKAAGDLAGDVTGKAYENLAPGGGGDSPPPPNGAPKINDNPALGGGQHQGQTPRQQRQIDDFRKNYLHK